ncbi:MAG: threonine--tRNA ligase [Proteobacteria bacterium]|nr:threonine--tRNA ligase [Pseudomonadota bacterium]
MMQVRLPDGSVREYDGVVTGLDVAMSIGPGLARAAVATKVNGELQDLSIPIADQSLVSIVTLRDPDGLDIMRHTLTAQVLARAVKELYPGCKLAIGPTIDNGFYYDVEFEQTLGIDELPQIEAKMKQIISQKNNIVRKMTPRSEAISLFKQRNEPYKVDIIERTPEQEEFPIYHQEGSDFVDLCRGPHVPNLDRIGVFKLTKLAGAYWRGDSKNKMITRIYGTAFANKKELKQHLRMLEEAEKRDHRKLGKQLSLFHLQEEAVGQVFWHHKGWVIFTQLQEYIREKLRRYDYQEVNTPKIVSNVLYRKSGHWDKFGTGNMFITEAYGQECALKPMNCPCHVQIFNQGIKSYRDLPIRMSEFGTCMRHETRGALHGIMRVTSMTQDDAHIFCTHDQISDEVVILCELIKEMYAEFGFTDVFVKFSDRPEQRVGSDEVWDAAEAALREACEKAELEWELNPGEGAFYGPKLEFVLKDSIGRHWQCGTIQLDFNLPERLGAKYSAHDNVDRYPVMIHRALLGSLERFIGVLIEHYAGHFPLWLAPIQIMLTGITDKQNEHVTKLRQRLKDEGFRVEADTRTERIKFKIREHSLQKIPVIGVFGDREIEDGTVTVRRFGNPKPKNMSLEDFISSLKAEVAERAIYSAGE